MNKITEKTKTREYYVGKLHKEEIPIFVTTDNSEFENKSDAEKHQNYLDRKEEEYNKFKVVTTKDIEDWTKDWYIIKSKEELIELENYIREYNTKYLSQFSFIDKIKEFPVALYYYINDFGDSRPEIIWEVLTHADISKIYLEMLNKNEINKCLKTIGICDVCKFCKKDIPVNFNKDSICEECEIKNKI